VWVVDRHILLDVCFQRNDYQIVMQAFSIEVKSLVLSTESRVQAVNFYRREIVADEIADE